MPFFNFFIFLSVYSDSESESEDTETFQPSGVPYKGDAFTPVFGYTNTAFSAKSFVSILLTSFELEYLAVSLPVDIENNVVSC